MLRIRRFEEKCAELYSAAQDPRLPASVHRRRSGRRRRDAGARTPTTRSSPPTASTATRWCAASRPDAIMAEMYGKREGCSRGRGGSMHLFDARHALLRRQCDRRRRTAARGRPGAGRQDAGPRARHGVLLRRRRGRRRRVPREHEPGRAVEAAGAVLAARTTSMRWARRSAAPNRRPICVSRRAATKCPHGRSTAWTCSLAKRRRGRAVEARARRRGPVLSRVSHLPLPCALDVRPELYRDKQEIEEWKKRDPIVTFRGTSARTGAARVTETSRRSRTTWRRRSYKAVEFAEAGTWEPVEDLTGSSIPKGPHHDAASKRSLAASPIARRCARRSAMRCSATRACS